MDRKYAKKIIESPHDRIWYAQGFGKMSTTITQNSKLHVWDRALLNPRVPSVHSHSYDFKSFVVVGKVRNLRMYEAEDGEEWNKVLVTAASEVVRGPEKARLMEHPMELHTEGSQYSQQKHEIHMSIPEDGTITLVEWDFDVTPVHMNVYWRGRSLWASAKSRRATYEEVENVTRNCLEVWY